MLMELKAIPGLPEKVAVEIGGRGLAFIRTDGLKVFFDDCREKWAIRLNQVRMYAPRAEVIKAVGLIKGLLIARNYAEKWGNEEEQAEINNYLENVTDKKLKLQYGN